TQAKSLDQDKEPLTVSVNQGGQVYLQNTEIAVEELVPKLKAITEARGGAEERIFVRGDRQVDYGTVMKVMGRISAAGFRRVALGTESEQQASARWWRDEDNEDGLHHIGDRARSGVAVERVVAFGHVASGGVDRGSAGRPRDRVRFLQDHGRQQGRAESRDAQAPGRKGRRGEPGRGSDREGGGKEGSQSRARAAAGAGSQTHRTRARKKASRGKAQSDRRRAREGRSQEARAEKGRRQAADSAEEARPTDAQVRSQAGRSVARQARLDTSRRRR